MDEKALRAFMTRTREQADAILSAEHIGADVKSVIKDLIQVSQNIDQFMQLSSGQSADARVLKKKLEQAKADIKAAEAKQEALKQLLTTLIDEIKVISAESQALAKLVGADAAAPGAQAVQKIRASVQKMAETIIKGTAKP